MRAIKFRVWCEERKQMLDIQRHSFKTGKSMPYGWNLEYVFDGIMQYTGLKDIDGKDIWEGDLFSVEDDTEYEYSGRFPSAPEICKVIYSDEYAAFCVASLRGEIYDRVIEYTDLAVVGNIYENPELLEVNYE